MAKSTPINYLFDVPTSDGHCTDPSHSSSVVCLPNREDRSITLFAQIFFFLFLFSLLSSLIPVKEEEREAAAYDLWTAPEKGKEEL